jgi:tRNA U55 pseudouridine synthase TruB
MNGFLLVNKEKGYSSNEIVQKIKKKFSLNKVGIKKSITNEK